MKERINDRKMKHGVTVATKNGEISIIDTLNKYELSLSIDC
jgi:hypothetical protein